MRSPIATLQDLTIPMGATSSPHIHLGPNLPAALKAIPDANLTAAAIWYFDADEYFFIASGTWISAGNRLVLIGTVDNTTGLNIWQRYSPGGTPASAAWGTTIFDSNHPVMNVNDMDWNYAIDSKLTMGGLLSILGDFTIDAKSAGRGVKAFIPATADLALIGVGGVDAIPITGITFAAGRAYRLEIGGSFTGSVANRLRITPYVQPGGAANELIDFSWYGPSAAGNPYPTYGTDYVRNSTVADKSRNVGVFVASSAGTCTWLGSGSSHYFLRISDAGAATDYANAREVP